MILMFLFNFFLFMFVCCVCSAENGKSAIKGNQEDFFEINILRVFLCICGNFTAQWSEYFPESLLPLNLRSHWLLSSPAPLKPHKCKPKSELLQNSDTRHQRQICRKAECNWKRDRLLVSFQIFKDSLTSYQNAAKSVKADW